MIKATSEMPRYRTCFSDGTHEGISDATPDKGGGGCGFRPHDLLEAALASCVDMTVRMYAEHHGIPLARVTTRVELDRGLPGETVFRYDVELDGDLTPEQSTRLAMAARACPVRRTLSQKIRFESGAGDPKP